MRFRRELLLAHPRYQMTPPNGIEQGGGDGRGAAVVEGLKRHLKAQKMTYAAVAKSLRVSEASIKRMFSKGSFTLDRFDQVCQFAGTSLTELAREADSGKMHISQLTHEQEKEITRDNKLLVVALCVLNQLTPDQIVETYERLEDRMYSAAGEARSHQVSGAAAKQSGQAAGGADVFLAAGRTDPAVLQDARAERIFPFAVRRAGRDPAAGERHAVTRIDPNMLAQAQASGQRVLGDACRGCRTGRWASGGRRAWLLRCGRGSWTISGELRRKKPAERGARR